MRSLHPKVLHKVMGCAMLRYVLETLYSLGVRDFCVVVGAGSDEVRSFVAEWKKGKPVSIRLVFQKVQKGTGHAVMMTQPFLKYPGEVLIWPGDMPLMKPRTIRTLMRCHRESSNSATVLSALHQDPFGYGRIIRAGGDFIAIREEIDASEAEKRIQEVSSGIYLFKTEDLFPALKKIKPLNRKKELYLTDTVEILIQQGKKVEALPLALGEEAQGINSREDLATAVRTMKNREIQYHQERGVTILFPEQTYIEPGAKIGRDTVIFPWSYIEAGVRIGRNCQIGPFAKIRTGTRIEDGAAIGSFVEVNRSKIGKKVLAKHLSYLGDAVIGDMTNVGAGTITANYDGKKKHVTRIGKKVLIGSNTVFVAPVKVADQVRTGAGAVLTRRTKTKKGEVVVGVPARVVKKKAGYR
ncbi:MAG: bifunctional N-acetylglucosamine-1-phosphate uridyltransferase/glucosamine-1-phosphate acetyltransferase [Candidatus Omnitrophica bacterium]|nr:bifunctional N-acetylglucosamine-1-phosphate uridyltransferase/glucosamine-1-phosphate acetyltransferase [Candidatus Omnitrophota bacterium]